MQPGRTRSVMPWLKENVIRGGTRASHRFAEEAEASRSPGDVLRVPVGTCCCCSVVGAAGWSSTNHQQYDDAGDAQSHCSPVTV